jgi:hypothetical protein
MQVRVNSHRTAPHHRKGGVAGPMSECMSHPVGSTRSPQTRNRKIPSKAEKTQIRIAEMTRAQNTSKRHTFRSPMNALPVSEKAREKPQKNHCVPQQISLKIIKIKKE